MKQALILTALAVILISGSVFSTQIPMIQGEYIEARSASVYVGACHYGSEYVEGGKEATLIWNINKGIWNDVQLDGLTVVAVVSAKDNLAIDTKTRRSAVYVDSKATPEQHAAISDMLSKKQIDVLGTVVTTQTAPIDYTKDGTKYDVSVGEVLQLSVNRFPCEHCTQPHQIWYEPLIEVQNPIVGKSEVYRYKDTHLPVNWQQGEATNNVFVADFSM